MDARWLRAGGGLLLIGGLAWVTMARIRMLVTNADEAVSHIDVPKVPLRRVATQPSSRPSLDQGTTSFESGESPVTSDKRLSSSKTPSSLAALEGLELMTIDEGVRDQLRVPRSDQIGRGVLVTRVHPDSPGAEIALQPRDVIVRAQRRPVNELSDLENIVRGRDHTLLIVARNGRLYEMVIKPPFVP